MQPSTSGDAAKPPPLDANDKLNWSVAFLPDCSAETILTADLVIYATPGDYGEQGRAVLTNYQLLYKTPGTLTARSAPDAFPLIGLISAELRPELYGFTSLLLVGAHYKSLVLYFASRSIAVSVHSKMQDLASLQLPALPAFRSPGLQQRWAWAPSEINKDWLRLGLPNQRWRLSLLNSAFRVCPSYPSELFVPASITDAQLERAAAYREGGRFASLSQLFPSGALLARCSQPRPSPGGSMIKGIKCAEDIALLTAMMDSKPFRMLDVRPRVRSVSDADLGMAAAEDPADYPGLTFQYLGLDSVFAAKHALLKLYAACDDPSECAHLSLLHFYYYLLVPMGNPQVSELLAAAKDTLAMLQSGTSVVIRSAEGGDEDSLLSSLILLLCDPFYRTPSGFRTLIEREWVMAGHKFATRLALVGNKDREPGRAPVFLQFLDACYQILKQFPAAFQFRESFFVALADFLHTGRFGNFLHNSARERSTAELERQTPSVWTALSESIYFNELYDASIGALVNVDHRLSHLSFWRNYHLSHRLRDFTLLSAPRKPPVNVYAQWRELQSAEAHLVKTVTLMEMRQREREAAPEDKGNTEAEKLRNRLHDLQNKLERAEKATKGLEKEIASTKEANRKLAEECRIMRSQADPSTTLSGIALDTRVLIGVSATSAAPATLQAYHKFYLRLLDCVKELLLSSQQLVDDVSGAQESTEATRKYCTNLAYEFVETVEISPHTSTSLLQEAKAVRESLLLLVAAAEEEERGNDRAATHLQTACQLVAANVSTCIEAAAAPLKDLNPAAQSTLSRLSPQSGVAFGSPTPAPYPASPADKPAKSDEARAADAMKKVGRLTTILRNRDVLKEIQQKKESAGSRRMQIAAAAAQAAAIAKQQANEEKRTQLMLAGLPPSELPPPPPSDPPPLQPLLADAVGEAQNRQNTLAALGAIQAPPPPDPHHPETGSRREIYLKAIQTPAPKLTGKPGETTIKSGYLTKRGEGLRTWKRRWFVLRVDALTYYAMVGATSPKGSIVFEGGVALSPHSGKKPHCFSIITPKRTYYLAAKDEEERNAWFSALANVLPQTHP